MKKVVWKFATGDEIPKGAIYLCTKVDNSIYATLVWHYFLVDKPTKERKKT